MWRQSGGGANFNVVPEACWFTIDRRINPEEDWQAEKKIARVLESCKREGIPLEWEICKKGRPRVPRGGTAGRSPGS